MHDNWKTILSFDFETTGTSVTKDRIIQSSLILIDSTTLKEIERKKDTFNNENVPIHPKAFEAHGISESDLVGKPLFSTYAKKYYDYFNAADYWHGYNIKSFDVPMLVESLFRCGYDLQPKPIIDSCVIFKRKEERTLSAAKKFYCGTSLDGAHDAENDVLASISVLEIQKLYYGLYDEEMLVSESCYDGEQNRLTFDGLIVMKDGKPCWNEKFGKNKGMPVMNDLNYVNWFMTADFPLQTKNVLNKIINNQK